jgi:hypothetical protein
MTSPDDIRLLGAVRAVFEELDPVPPEVLAAARGAYSWRTVDAELAELVLDSLTTSTAGVRSTSGPRLVTFEADRLTVEVEVGETGRTRRIVGQLVPPGRAIVAVRWARGEQTVEADELGRFAVDGVPAGPVSLLCRLAEAPERPVVTSWVNI